MYIMNWTVAKCMLLVLMLSEFGDYVGNIMLQVVPGSLFRQGMVVIPQVKGLLFQSQINKY